MGTANIAYVLTDRDMRVLGRGSFAAPIWQIVIQQLAYI